MSESMYVLCVELEKPVVRSSYFQQMMQDAANSRHTVNTSAQSTTDTNSVDVMTDKTTRQHHSNTSTAAATASTQHPVDSTKSTQQLIGQNALFDLRRDFQLETRLHLHTYHLRYVCKQKTVIENHI